MEWELFTGVPEEDVRRLLAIARRRTFDRGEVVFHRGDPADCLHLIVSGRFAVGIRTPRCNGTARRTGPGDAFGELALIAREGVQRSATVAALEPAETQCSSGTSNGSGASIRASTACSPGCSASGCGLSDQLTEAYYLPADKRVVHRVAELGELYGGEILAQEQLAELAGTSRATANRVLRDLERRVVELHRGTVVIREPEQLRRQSGRRGSKRRNPLCGLGGTGCRKTSTAISRGFNMFKATLAVLAVALTFSTSAAAERSLFFEETASAFWAVPHECVDGSTVQGTCWC